MKRQKILQISHSYEAPFLDVANQYAALFDPEKYEVTSLFLKGEERQDIRESALGEKIIFLELKTSQMKGLKTKVIRKVGELIKAENYDLIVAQRYKSMYVAGLASLFNPVKIIGVVHAYGVFDSWSRRLFLSRQKDKFHILGVSEDIRANVAKQLSKVGFEKVYSQPNALDTEALEGKVLAQQEAREALNLPQDAFIFGSVGRLHPDKDPQTLIKAFAQESEKMPNAHLAFMGFGRLEEELKDLTKSLGIANKVTFLGKVANGPCYFKAFDVFALASAREPFGMVFIEAMNADVPVITSATGGALEVVANDEQIFPIGDTSCAGQRLLEAYQWPESKRAEIIANGRERVQRLYTFKAFRDNFWNLFADL